MVSSLKRGGVPGGDGFALGVAVAAKGERASRGVVLESSVALVTDSETGTLA